MLSQPLGRSRSSHAAALAYAKSFGLFGLLQRCSSSSPETHQRLPGEVSRVELTAESRRKAFPIHAPSGDPESATWNQEPHEVTEEHIERHLGSTRAFCINPSSLLPGNAAICTVEHPGLVGEPQLASGFNCNDSAATE